MMQSSNTELMKVISELKALPIRDRKAIERQLSGLDKIAVKKALKIAPLFSELDVIETEVEVEPEDKHDDRAGPNTAIFSPQLSKRLSTLLENEGGDLSTVGVTRAVINILPDCVEQTNVVLDKNSIDIAKSDKSSGFKSILAKLRGGEV